MERGLPQAPRWAWIATALAVVWLIVVALFGSSWHSADPVSQAELDRISAAQAAAEASRAAANSPPASFVVPPDPRLLVFGDSYVEGVGANSPSTIFASQAAAQLGWPVELNGVGGTGYLNPGQSGATYLERLATLRAESQPNIILVEGGINDRDRNPSREIVAPAVQLVDELKDRFPDATIIIMGPVDPQPVSTWVRRMTSDLRLAATNSRALFIDASDWLTPDNISQYTYGDAVHVNQAGHDYIGDRLAEAIRSLQGPAAP